VGGDKGILRSVATIVAFHAHPDDEAILTGGTFASLSAAGHRIVVVTATDGRMGNDVDSTRMDELRSSIEILDVHRLEMPRCRIRHRRTAGPTPKTVQSDSIDRPQEIALGLLRSRYRPIRDALGFVVTRAAVFQPGITAKVSYIL
jgi:LmbE family N-acetylglucosaminyl deacetylase